jgi:GntR family transcriptional regulator
MEKPALSLTQQKHARRRRTGFPDRLLNPPYAGFYKAAPSLDIPSSLYIVSIQMTNEGTPKILRIDLNLPVPAYRQIADGLLALLVNGTFQPGDRLPTVRQLAIDLAVHHNTVAQAYRLLAEEGWLELKRHRGAKVIPRRTQPPTAASQRNFAQRLRELAARALADGVDPKSVSQQLAAMAHELKP